MAREYQSDGLAAIHGWCGVNVELSKKARDLWSSENLENPDLAVQRAYIINGLSALFTFAEERVERHLGQMLGNYDDCF